MVDSIRYANQTIPWMGNSKGKTSGSTLCCGPKLISDITQHTWIYSSKLSILFYSSSGSTKLSIAWSCTVGSVYYRQRGEGKSAKPNGYILARTGTQCWHWPQTTERQPPSRWWDPILRYPSANRKQLYSSLSCVSLGNPGAPGKSGDSILTPGYTTYLIYSQWHTLDGPFSTSHVGGIRETKAEGGQKEIQTAMPPSASQGEKIFYTCKRHKVLDNHRSDARCPGLIKMGKVLIISTGLWCGLYFNVHAA